MLTANGSKLEKFTVSKILYQDDRFVVVQETWRLVIHEILQSIDVVTLDHPIRSHYYNKEKMLGWFSRSLVEKWITEHTPSQVIDEKRSGSLTSKIPFIATHVYRSVK